MSWIDLGLAVHRSSRPRRIPLPGGPRRSGSPADRLPLGPLPRLRFDVVVPAHDEEAEIARTVESLLALDYPRELFRVVVIADNCRDHTAARAAAAGAQVMVRNEPEHRGKGYALAHAFGRSLAEDFADAVVVVDADTVVSSNLLTAFAGRFETGAAVVQADYGVRNPRSSWRTRMMTIALATFHGVRSLARERLGLSCGLRGNGMGFSRAVLRAQPVQRLFHRRGPGIRAPTGIRGISRAVRPRGQGSGPDGRHGTSLALPAAPLGAWTASSRPAAGPPPAVGKPGIGGTFSSSTSPPICMVPPLGQLVALNAIGTALCVLAAWLAGGAMPMAASVWGVSFLGMLLYVRPRMGPVGNRAVRLDRPALGARVRRSGS